MAIDEDKAFRLFSRALAILDNHKPGFGAPILRHLAVRRYEPGMTELARLLQQRGELGDKTEGLMLYAAWRTGSSLAAQNRAMSCFNRRDLAGYRRWLWRAAKSGDDEAKEELRRFETRLPHGAARDIGRGRPDLAHDGWWDERRVARRRTAMHGRSS